MLYNIISVSPNRRPQVEAVQIESSCIGPRQMHQSREPIGHMHQLLRSGSVFLQQGAVDKSHTPDASFPQWSLPPSQRPVVPALCHLTSIVCKKDQSRSNFMTIMHKIARQYLYLIVNIPKWSIGIESLINVFYLLWHNNGAETWAMKKEFELILRAMDTMP